MAGAGIVSIANLPAQFSGRNLFTRNSGPSLAVSIINIEQGACVIARAGCMW